MFMQNLENWKNYGSNYVLVHPYNYRKAFSNKLIHEFQVTSRPRAVTQFNCQWYAAPSSVAWYSLMAGFVFRVIEQIPSYLAF